jgi:hypothetical protein
LATTGSNSRPDYRLDLSAIREDSEIESTTRPGENPRVTEDALQTVDSPIRREATPVAVESLQACAHRLVTAVAGAHCAVQTLGVLPARTVSPSRCSQRAPPFRSREPDPVKETGPVGGSPTALIIRHAVRNFT